MATQIKVEYLIRPGSRIPVKIARQIIDEGQIVAITPTHAQSQAAVPIPYYANGQAAAGPSNVVPQAAVPTGPTRNAPRGPAQNKANGAFSGPSTSAPSKPRGAQQQQQNGSAQASKSQSNNNANYHKNAGSATSGKSLLQRMNIGLAERISGGPQMKGNPPTEPASAKKAKGKGVASTGPIRPNAR
jgi:hypothetical protein